MTVATQQKRPGKTRPLIPSSVLKIIMAVTGFIFVAFVFVHMIGNLKIYMGAESLNNYAHWLREVGYPLIPHKGVLWILRFTLAICLVLHVSAGLTIWARGRKARGKFRRKGLKKPTAIGAWLMVPTGLIILVFVIVHILDLTVGIGPAPESFTPGDAYGNVVASFSRPWMAAFYIFVMFVIAIHIVHGCRVMLQDFGATSKRLRQIWTLIGAAIALAVVLGNAAIPLCVQLGIIS